ncbi:TetR/AcrR family transcriptional regulator [Streptomyces ziwulingensis]|uniref:TetR/AcrR family transcriptional regulator n=1 Tax=Streptomyces ziwulingensis TaxID=1045501 RepID=A0ABP9D2N6_9ACTN
MSVVPAEPVESPEPAWRQRAVERSTRAAKLRAEQRVQRFLDAARELITDKGTTDFTVQEVVERSRQSLRSFYQHFDGKHELLLALFEDALSRSAIEMREKLSTVAGPLERLKVAVGLLYDASTPRQGQQSPLFTDFAVQLLVSHPDQVATAHLPLLTLFTELVEGAVEAGSAVAPRPRRTASLIMQTAMFTAQAPAAPVGAPPSRIGAEDVWEFCLGGITGAREEAEVRAGAARKSPAARKTAAKRAPSKKSATTKDTAHGTA